MTKNCWLLSAGSFGLVLFYALAAQAQYTSREHLHGHVPQAISRFRLQPIGRPAASQQLHLAIGLPPRNEPALDELLRQIYDPASPNFRQYLTPEQFAERFGPAPRDYQAVIRFAEANGLKVTGTHLSRVVLDVQGSVADVERALHVTLRTYRHPHEARDFYAPDSDPSLDLAIPILHVSGLDNYSLPHPANLVKKELPEPLGNLTPNAGSGPSGSYRGNDFRAAYVPGVSLTGSNQSVALVQFDGYYSNDIAMYISQAGLTNYSIRLTNVAVNGGVSSPGSGNSEVALDIEMVISMAPGASKIIVYEAPNGPTPWSTMLSSIANDTVNQAKQIGCSWGGGGADPTSEVIFKQMAAQGQSFFNASGDSCAFVSSIPFPADSTNITQVGGTTLSTTGPGGSYLSETVWNWGGGQGSSGGVSPTYGIPGWQQGIDMTTNLGSTTMRNIPDVALTGDNVYVIHSNGSTGIFGGTSCAAPLWAGFMALVNEQAVVHGKPVVGFINPAIYTIGKGANYTADFHDVTTGNNTWSSSPTHYYATNGYDLCTGWGTPNGLNLINALAIPDSFGVTPGTGFNAIGPAAGPFSAAAQNFALTNSGGSSLTWTVLGKPAWLDISSAGGTLAANGSATVNVNLNGTAYYLTNGIYSADLIFSNLNSGLPQLRYFSLQVGQSLVQNGGFETGDFSYWTLTDDNLSLVDTGYFSLIAPHSGNYLAAFGQPSSPGHLFQTLTTIPNQDYLISLWFNSPDVLGGNTPNEFIVSWGGTTLFDQSNIGPINWTNMTFIVTATNSSTVLQFGERVDPWYLGLDDVNVWPIPNPFIRSAVKTNGNNFVFSWNSLAGLKYRVEYRTNLAQAGWVILGTNTATGSITSYTNAYGSDPRRFYHVRRLP